MLPHALRMSPPKEAVRPPHAGGSLRGYWPTDPADYLTYGLVVGLGSLALMWLFGGLIALFFNVGPCFNGVGGALVGVVFQGGGAGLFVGACLFLLGMVFTITRWSS